jgi:photosystem II stability/assembly factor-like uncharacterized protein
MKKFIISLLILIATIVVVWAQEPHKNIYQNKWRVSAEGKIQQYSDSIWVNAETPTNQPIAAFFFLSEEVGWAVGKNATIIRWDGERWSEVLVFTNENLNSVFLTSANEGWAVGGRGSILRWDGISWNQEQCPIEETLVNISTTQTGVLEIKSENGTILQRTNNQWFIYSTVQPQLSASVKQEK